MSDLLSSSNEQKILHRKIQYQTYFEFELKLRSMPMNDPSSVKYHSFGNKNCLRIQYVLWMAGPVLRDSSMIGMRRAVRWRRYEPFCLLIKKITPGTSN